ncbi:MAG: hypothetical protein QOI10_2604 [Solirubrobacterales bacterium]|jgi:hypothetical protein|nr:hypothetical protein [Solirubrobacterales bacterium]
MSFVVSRANGWEIRESVSTERGPRSRTLATFKRLDRATLEHAAGRASKPIDRERLISAALRAGAPVEVSPADAHAGALIRALDRGDVPRPALRRLLVGYLTDERASSDAATGAAAWLGASAADRGAALVDLLRLGDAIPAGRRSSRSSFPGFGRAP